jgi:hypothetical protein
VYVQIHMYQSTQRLGRLSPFQKKKLCIYKPAYKEKEPNLRNMQGVKISNLTLEHLSRLHLDACTYSIYLSEKARH